VIAMIALPVMGLTLAGVIVSTATPTAEEEATGQMGSADVALHAADLTSVEEELRGLPEGESSLRYGWDTWTVVGGTRYSVLIEDVDPGDPILGPIYKMTSGRAPEGPDEIVVSPPVLDRFNVVVGDTITLTDEDIPYTIVGTVIRREQIGRSVALVEPGSLFDKPDAYLLGVYVDFPTDREQAAVDTIREGDFGAYQLREYFDYGLDPSTKSLGIPFAIAALVLAETGLIAAAAFVVGTKRQMRTIGLVGATGGGPRNARMLVLAGGVLLGLVGSIAGVILGILAAVAIVPHLDRLTGRIVGPLSLTPYLPVGAIALGTIAASLAAYSPARAASRMSTVDALEGRTPPPRPAGKLARMGMLAVVLGAVVTAWATATKSNPGLVVGLFLTIGGVLVAIPLFVVLVGRIGTRLPLPARIAARDTARHGRRTGAAVAAATVALLLPIAVSTGTLATEAKENASPLLAADQILIRIRIPFGIGPEVEDEAVHAYLTQLTTDIFPGAVTAGYAMAFFPETSSEGFDFEQGAEQRMPVYVIGQPKYVGDEIVEWPGDVIQIGEPDLLDTLHAEGVRSDFEAGAVVVLRPDLVEDGRVRIETPGPSEFGEEGTFLRAVYAPVNSFRAGAQLPGAVISQARAKELGFEEDPISHIVLRSRHPVTNEQLTDAKTLAATVDGLSVTGPSDIAFKAGPIRVGVLAFTGLIALAIVGVAVALIAAESRRDRAVLDSIGASPRTRRAIAASSAALLTALAAILAVPAGFIPVTVVQLASDDGYGVAVPWVSIATVIIILPAIAGLVAGALSRTPASTSLRQIT